MEKEQAELVADLTGRLLLNYAVIGSRIIALEAVSAKIIQEICNFSEKPDEHMIKLTSEIRGLADAVAHGTNVLVAVKGFDPSELTRALERICDMAETNFRPGN